MFSIEFEDTGSEETTKGVTELLRDVQCRNTLPKLGLVVPRGKVINGTGKESKEEHYISGIS